MISFVLSARTNGFKSSKGSLNLNWSPTATKARGTIVLASEDKTLSTIG